MSYITLGMHTAIKLSRTCPAVGIRGILQTARPGISPADHETPRRCAVAANVSSLVDAEKGLVSRRIFIEPDIYQQELEQIFARCWLFLCHETQIPIPGTFSPLTWGKTRCWSCVTPAAR